MKRIVVAVLCLQSVFVMGQRPVITQVDPITTYPLNQVLITGSGFNATAANNQVWFDQIRGQVVRATESSLLVTVPPQARLHNVEVINLTSRLSAKSNLKFMPSYSGEGFDPSKLTAPLSFTSTNAIFDVCACDLNNDNKPELVGSKFENIATDLIVLENTSTPGNIAFNKLDKANSPSLNLNIPTGFVTCGDLNGDGKPDLVASRSGATANSVVVLQNTSAGSISLAAKLELFLDVGHFARQVIINDLNADGKPEIIVANSFNNDFYIFVNQSSGGTLTILATPIKISLTGVSKTLALEIQDMDGDKKPDIVATDNQGPGLYIMKNQSTGTISFAAPVVRAQLGSSFNDVNSADFNGDGKLDLALSSVFNDQVMVLLNTSTAANYSFSAPITMTTGDQPFGVEVSDIDGNGFPDIIVPNRNEAKIDVYLHNGSNTPGFSRVIVNTTKFNWFSKVGDLDGDAKPDIAVTAFNNSTFNYTIDVLRNRNCHLPQILNEPPVTLCPGQTIQLDAIPAPAVTFDWKNGGVSFKNGADAFADINVIGAYTVTAVGEGGACNVESKQLDVTVGVGTVPATPTINPITPACSGSNVNITTSSVTGASYLWEGPSGFSTTTATPTLALTNVNNTQAGLYSLRVKVGDCTSDSDTEELSVVDLASFSVTSNLAGPLCQGQNAVLSVNSATGYTYQWIKDGGDMAGQTNNTLTVTLAGAYKARVTFTGCSTETEAVNVAVVTAPVAAFTVKTSACLGELLTFTNTSTTDAQATVVYAWDFGDGETDSDQNPTHSYSAVQSYNAQLTVSYSGVASCSNQTSQSIAVTDANPPVIAASETIMCPGDQVTLSITGAYTSITWSNNATTSSTTITQPGTYTVNTTEAGGCEATDEIVIDQKESCGVVVVEIAASKMFSPNGDTQNDYWVITGSENYPDCSFSIFDDKGIRVFQQTGYPPEGWNGLHSNGKEAPDGVYYYIVSCPGGKPVTGSVTILR